MLSNGKRPYIREEWQNPKACSPFVFRVLFNWISSRFLSFWENIRETTLLMCVCVCVCVCVVQERTQLIGITQPQFKWRNSYLLWGLVKWYSTKKVRWMRTSLSMGPRGLSAFLAWRRKHSMLPQLTASIKKIKRWTKSKEEGYVKRINFPTQKKNGKVYAN